MKSEDKIRERVLKLIAYKNQSPTGFAKGAGIAQSTLNRFLDPAQSKGGKSLRTLDKIAVYCGFESWDDIPPHFGAGITLEPEPVRDIILRMFMEWAKDNAADITLGQALQISDNLIRRAEIYGITKPNMQWITETYPLAKAEIKKEKAQ